MVHQKFKLPLASGIIIIEVKEEEYRWIMKCVSKDGKQYCLLTSLCKYDLIIS